MTTTNSQEHYPLDPRRDEKYARVYEISHSVQDIWNTLVRTGEIIIASEPEAPTHQVEVATVTELRRNNDRQPDITLAQAEVKNALVA